MHKFIYFTITILNTASDFYHHLLPVGQEITERRKLCDLFGSGSGISVDLLARGDIEDCAELFVLKLLDEPAAFELGIGCVAAEIYSSKHLQKVKV